MDSVSLKVKLNMGYYSISLPIKNKDVTFPNNRAAALQRVESLKKEIINKSGVLSGYGTYRIMGSTTQQSTS